MFQTAPRSKKPKSGNLKPIQRTIQDRVREVKTSWNDEEREQRKVLAERRLEQLLRLLGMGRQFDAA